MLYLRHGKHQDGSDDWQIYCCGPGLTVARLNLKVREEQKLKIQRVLKEVEGGRHVKDICRENGISKASYYIYGLPPFCKH
ncbi:transposase [Enterobacillus tribolii]|uniref:Transposase n=1 Tax=Enterobacillus tribolii TaxID=1487935 RepID=A0A370QLY4_9GAMM|nr:transposase [Enterobacillus tribolii]